MESTEAPGVSFCLPHPELGDFFLTGSALLETVGFDLIRLGTRKQPSGRPRIASRLPEKLFPLSVRVRPKIDRPVGVKLVRLDMGSYMGRR